MPVHACVAHQIHQLPHFPSDKNRTNSHVVLSGLSLTCIPGTIIKNRENIKSLNLDHNCLTENSFNMPTFKNLKELSVRNNKIRDVGLFIANLQRNCPNLEVLIVKNNPGWPEKLTHQEKTLISKCLKKLQILNGSETHRQKKLSGCSTVSNASSSASE